MHPEHIFISTCKVAFDRVSFYDIYQGIRRPEINNPNSATIEKTSDAIDQSKNPNRKHDGELSATGKINLLRAIERFVFYTRRVNNHKKAKGIKGKRSLKFITLTLASSQVHSDVEIKKVALNQFLTELRQKYNLKHYVWKAEKQDNGNIHFHILIDVYIHYKEIRDIWNRCQNKLGYVDRFSKRMQEIGLQGYLDIMIFAQPDKSKQYLVNRYKRLKKEGFKNPPSTEIRQVEKIRNTRNYFAKYFSKESGVEPGFGRIWFASRSLTKDLSLKVEYSGFKNYLINELEQLFPDKKRVYDYSIVFWISYDILESFIKHKWLEWYSRELDQFTKEFW